MLIKKNYLFSLIIIFCFLFIVSPLITTKTVSQPNQTSIIEAAEKDSALQAMLNSFEIYYSFLNDIEIRQGYYIPLHGRTQIKAIDYLGEGFEENLATAIVDEYTFFIPELDCLAINPTDGLPVLNKDDIPYLTCSKISNKHIIFSREFTGCYSPRDCYRYQVEMQLYQGHWKISAFSLEKLN